MAKVLGEAGRYVSNEAARQRIRLLDLVIGLLIVLGVVEGFLISHFFHPNSNFPSLHAGVMIAVLLLVLAIYKFGCRKLEALDKAQTNYQKGADGEDIVGRILARFPEDFSVIHDLKTPFGNLDHVVIGPTGVFVLDTKNWRGVVSSDGKGELVWNGKPTSKSEIRQFTARLMNIKAKVKLLASGFDPYHRAIFVFTSARIDARWGTTGKVHCISELQLREHIVEKDFGKRLKKDEVDRIARAFLGLAQMEIGFPEPSVNRKVQVSALVPALN